MELSLLILAKTQRPWKTMVIDPEIQKHWPMDLAVASVFQLPLASNCITLPCGWAQPDQPIAVARTAIAEEYLDGAAQAIFRQVFSSNS